MTFDLFGDFEESDYLRNFAGEKDLEKVTHLEHDAFLRAVQGVLDELATQKPLTYGAILETHEKLFGAAYPWAGQDRFETALDINISKGGYTFGVTKLTPCPIDRDRPRGRGRDCRTPRSPR